MREPVSRGDLLCNLILSLGPLSLPPSRAGGEWVGLPSHEPRDRPRGFSLLPVIPPKSPSPVNRGRRGVTGRQRTRTLAQEVFMEVFRFRSVAKDSPSKPVTALVGLERWRGFCGGRQTLNIEAAAVAAVHSGFGLWPRSQDGGWGLAGHSSCAVMICGRPGFGKHGCTSILWFRTRVRLHRTLVVARRRRRSMLNLLVRLVTLTGTQR